MKDFDCLLPHNLHAGNIFSFMVYLAPIPTFRRVYKAKSTLDFQSVPYVVALFSAMLWIFYALIKTNSVLLITINSVGCVIESVYIVMFLIFAPPKSRVRTFGYMFLLNGVVFAGIVLFTMFLSHGINRATILGWICMTFSVSVFAAPLSIIRLVIRTRSVEFMPLALSCFLTASAVCWGLYGAFSHDRYIALPNVLGFLFGVGQIGLYLYYRRCPTIVHPETPFHETPAPATAKNALDLPGIIELPENLHVAIVAMTPVPVVQVRRIEPELDLEANTPFSAPVKTG
ncbi:bidirectional sugar transporter SWEET14-like protein [Carex littledalei]|uniref:Bidirectional sugar transporter SWEET n=1 Tax=Carex littledalei TaxID=544730 RepID=A0A833QTD2_9POAL|nr:bidirectional sugar transporter SWEET14-like protein [Carex littledalei]